VDGMANKLTVKVGGYWQLILFAWVYSDRGACLYLSEFID
jgi:hypothetical protein